MRPAVSIIGVHVEYGYFKNSLQKEVGTARSGKLRNENKVNGKICCVWANEITSEIKRGHVTIVLYRGRETLFADIAALI